MIMDLCHESGSYVTLEERVEVKRQYGTLMKDKSYVAGSY
jgi:hypothetical protein